MDYKCPRNVTINSSKRKDILKSCKTCVNPQKCVGGNCNKLDQLLKKYGWTTEFTDDNGNKTTLKELINNLDSKELISQVLYDRCNNVNCNAITDKFDSKIESYPTFLSKIWDNYLGGTVFVLSFLVSAYIIFRAIKKNIPPVPTIVYSLLLLIFFGILVTSLTFNQTTLIFSLIFVCLIGITILIRQFPSAANIIYGLIILLIVIFTVYTITMIAEEGSLTLLGTEYSKSLLASASIILILTVLGLIYSFYRARSIQGLTNYGKLLVETLKLSVNGFMLLTMSPLYLPFLFIQKYINNGEWSLLLMGNIFNVPNSDLSFNKNYLSIKKND